MGILKTIAIVSNEVSKGKLNLLRLFGINVRVNKEPICPDPNDKTSGIYKAKIWARENGWYNPGQYDNPHNFEAHIKWTGQQIWQQTNGKIALFCAGLGTTGTMMGTGRFLKKKNDSIRTIGVVRKPNNPVPGPRTRHLLSQIAFNWSNVVDHIEEVGTFDAYETSLMLTRNGLMVGPSSGFNLKGLFCFLDQLIQTGELKKLQHNFNEIVSVFVACDTPFPYVEDYFKYLTASHFPDIENKELLNHQPEDTELKENATDPAPYEITVNAAYHLIFSLPPNLVWQHLKEGKTIATHPNTVTIDLRDAAKYQTSHIPGAKNIPFEKLNKNYAYYQKKWTDLIILFFCNQGEISNHATRLFRKDQIEAFSIKNGLIGWSKADLPRWQPQSCRIRAIHH